MKRKRNDFTLLAREPVANPGENARVGEIVPLVRGFRDHASLVRGYSRRVATGERLARDLRTRCFTFQKESTVETSDRSGRSRSDVVHRRNARREDEDAVDRNVERRLFGKIFRGGGEGEVDEDFSAGYTKKLRINDAASVMQEVAIETYGALSKREKVFFIEEQIRLCMKNDDHVRARILSKKINVRSFDEIKRLEEKEMLKKKKKMEEEGGADAMVMDEDEKKRFEEVEKEEKKGGGERGATRERRVRGDGSERSRFTRLRLNYYKLMVQYFEREKDYLEQCRCYKAILECELVKEDKSKYEPAMESCGVVGRFERTRSNATKFTP